jgi:hypothetical protein
VAVSPDGALLVAAGKVQSAGYSNSHRNSSPPSKPFNFVGAFIKLFSVASQALICRYSSSSSAVTQASFSACGAQPSPCSKGRYFVTSFNTRFCLCYVRHTAQHLHLVHVAQSIKVTPFPPTLPLIVFQV